MRTGARLDVLDSTSLSLLRESQDLDAEHARLRAALGAVAAAAGLRPARLAADGAGEELVPVLRVLRDGVRTLGADLEEQAFAFRAADRP